MAVEHFDHRGRSWRRIPATPIDRFVMGVDLGQSVDPTAIAVLHHRVEPLKTWTVNDDRGTTAQDVEARFDVRHLERVALGTAYPAIVDHVRMLLARPPLNAGCELVIDETGVGRAVGDIFDEAGLDPIRISITAGNEVTAPTNRRFHVAKTILISALDARLHTGELRIAANLTDAGALADELKDFRRHVGAAGRASYSARTGRHDDLVLAVSIATWVAAGGARRGEFSTGTVAGLV